MASPVPEPPSARARVVVAMSGGVDSSVAAAFLLEAGWDVVGVTLHLWDAPDPEQESRCCAPEDQHTARRVADHLGIPHFTFDRRELFQRHVVEPFVEAYLAGRTPSPCVACNDHVKVRELVPLAARLGAERVATGHYARVVVRPGGVQLLRGRDPRKDQSYFLHVVEEGDLARLLLPLGELTKEEVRAEALRRGLPGASRGESQELCFVGASYARFVEERAAGRLRPGSLVDEGGRTLGRHDGVHRFTVGQRKGLGVSSSRPLFVTEIDADAGLVRLGGPDRAGAGGAVLGGLRLAPDAAAAAATGPLPVQVQVRYRAEPVPAVLSLAGEAPALRFERPVRAVAPGQVAVLLAGERVLGGGPIVRAIPASAPRLEEASA